MPGAGGINGSDYGSDAYTRSMRLMAMGDILKGGNGGAYMNYMQQLAAAQQADARFAAQQAAIEEQRAYERQMAEQAAAEQAAMLEAAQGDMAAYFNSINPSPVRPFDARDPTGADVAANAMAYVRPELFPGLPQAVINDAARNNTPASSALVSMFYNMPTDVAEDTRASYDDGMATFAYNDQAAQEWARQNAPEYGYGFEGVGPQAKFDAQQSMPTPVAPERLAQIMTNPMVPDEIKDMVLARFGGANSDMKWIDGVGMVDMNNPPPELMAGQYQPQDEDRARAEDQNGVLRYIDTGEPVFPGVTTATDATQNGPDFDTEQDLRKEYLALPVVKDFATVQQGWDRIQSAAENPSPAGDLGLIFSFMKVMDPGSVVRESEFATAESAAAWLQEAGQSGIDVPLPVATAIRRMATGQRLSDEQRADFVNQAAGFYNRHAERVNYEVSEYRRLAVEYGLSPDRIARAVETYQVDPERAAQIEAARDQRGSDQGATAPPQLNPLDAGPTGNGASGSWGVPSMPEAFSGSPEVEATAARLGVSVEDLWKQIIEQGKAGAWLR